MVWDLLTSQHIHRVFTSEILGDTFLHIEKNIIEYNLTPQKINASCEFHEKYSHTHHIYQLFKIEITCAFHLISFFNKKCDNKIVIKHLYTVYRMSEMNNWDIKESLRARGYLRLSPDRVTRHTVHSNYGHEFLQGHSLSLSLSCSLRVVCV